MDIMSRFALILLPVLLMVSSIVSAQTTTPTPAPWPPDPQQIFAKGVQWFIADEETVSAEAPLYIDPQRRLIRVYNTSSGAIREYAFPKDKDMYDAEFQSDGRIRVRLSSDGYYSPNETLILNPDTGQYEQPDLACKGKSLRDLPGEGRWDEIGHSYDNPFLCQTATDEQIVPTGIGLDWNSLIANVDDTHLILMDYRDNPSSEDPQVILYDLTNEKITVLGSMQYWSDVDDYASVCDWMTPTKGLICVNNSAFDWAATGYYAFDLTQPNSLQSVFGGWGDTIFKLENPTRYFSIDSEYYVSFVSSGSRWDTPCQINVYDIIGLHTHRLGGACLPFVWGADSISAVYGVPNFYYLATDEIAQSMLYTGISSLHRFDAETETMSEPLLTGEIENILGVSPDERYIALIMDNNGVLDFPWQHGSYLDKEWPVAILDTHSGKIVYQTEPIGITGGSDAEWIDNDTLILMSEDLWRIDLTEGKAITHHTDRYHWRNYNTCLRDANNFMVATIATGETVMVNMATFASLPLLRADLPSDYSIQISCHNGPLTVRVYSSENHASVTYRVEIP